MAVIIERGKEPKYVNGEDGVAAPAGGIAIGGKHEGTIVVGNGKVVEVKTNKATQDLANLADELDNKTYKKTAEDFTQEELAEILQKLELIKDQYPINYRDLMERLGLAEPKKDDTGTGAIATAGVVKAGKDGIVIPRDFKGNIVIGKGNKFK